MLLTPSDCLTASTFDLDGPRVNGEESQLRVESLRHIEEKLKLQKTLMLTVKLSKSGCCDFALLSGQLTGVTWLI
tara:strand:+ start:184 stop:408 length:225 start_codon:yes stop_codon:yes gene_type:complete